MPEIHKFGRRNGGNPDLVKKLLNNAIVLPCTPEFTWRWSVDLSKLKLLQALAIETSTIQITGAAPDGDYVLTLAGTLADGTAFSVELDPFTASSDTNDDIAAGLEAIIEAARAADEALENIVTAESVSTDTITTALAQGVVATWTLVQPATGTETIARSFSCTVDPTSRVRGKAIMPAFPERVTRSRTILEVVDAVAGPTTPQIIFGDDNDDNGLITVSSLASEGFAYTSAATEAADLEEAAFVPQAVITWSTAALTAATACDFHVSVRCKPLLPQ